MSQLREGHAEPLVPAGEAAQLPISLVTSHTPLKRALRNEVHQLRENHPTLIHHPTLWRIFSKPFSCVQIVSARSIREATENMTLNRHLQMLNRTAVGLSYKNAELRILGLLTL